MFARADEGVIPILADEAATDAVLASGPRLKGNVHGRTVINMGTVAPAWSEARGRDVEAAGGERVEAPVSGSHGPAEAGELVAMLAGRDAFVERVRPPLEPLCRATFACGHVPNALRTKLAVNLFLITMVTGLVEAVHLARRSGLDLEVFRAVLDAGPMASAVSRGKLDKLVRRDFAVQASIQDVVKNGRLVEGAARQAGAAAPLISACAPLSEAAERLGADDIDSFSRP